MTELELVKQLESLKQAARFAMSIIDKPEFWQRVKNLVNQYPDDTLYDLVNRAEYAEAMNVLYCALHQGEN